MASGFWRTHFLEIDKAAVHIDGYQLHANPVADIQAVEPVDQFPFHRHLEEPHPSPFVRSPRDDGVKLFVDSRFKKKRRRGFIDLPLDFVSGVLFFGAVFCQGIQFILAIGLGMAIEGGLQ